MALEQDDDEDSARTGVNNRRNHPMMTRGVKLLQAAAPTL
jgi:hypothetical protein